jgi:hypothetical protein
VADIETVFAGLGARLETIDGLRVREEAYLGCTFDVTVGAV